MADPVLIDDDDVVMVEDLLSKEPVVILDEDDETINNDKTLSVPSVSTEETIVVDDETPIMAGTPSKAMNKQEEKSFVNNLENNRLIDKIVTRCITMENATGMPRVVYKTLLPLYKDTCNRFKESDEFRSLLKKTYRLLMKDPDHKFLHIKTLCEELKSGGLRRKVPFVTLATNLKKKDSQSENIEFTSYSGGSNENRNGYVEIREIPDISRRNYTTPKEFGGKTKKRKVNPRDGVKTRSVTQAEKTDIIDLDDSETESADSDGSKNDDGQNDVIIVEETKTGDQKHDNLNSNKENNVIQDNLEKKSSDENEIIQETLEANYYKNIKETQSALQKDSNKQNQVIQATLAKDPKKENKFGKVYKRKGKQIQATIKTGSNMKNKMIQETLAKDSNIQNKVMPETLEKDSNKQNKLMQAPFVIFYNNEKDKLIQETLAKDSNIQNKVMPETLEKDSNKQNKLMQAPFVIFYNNEKHKLIQATVETDSNTQNKIIQKTLTNDKRTQATIGKDAINQNKELQDIILEENDRNGLSAENEMDYDLLIPKTRVEVLKYRTKVMSETEPPAKQVSGDEPGGGVEQGGGDEPGGGVEQGGGDEPEGSAGAGANPRFLSKDDEIAHLEKRIAYCKKCIDRLEETEVTTESAWSAYYICSRYKEDVVACYKKICQLTGNSQDIVKRREIRLQVTKGHPPGPAKRLEEFLNRTIDETGVVAFPDFSDVLKCVVESNLADNLSWNRHQIMQEAVALFRQCGNALRKRRQKREYRDLLSLIRDKEEADDPAEKDPLLLAKLEENKRIAKAKEEELLNSYVDMEQNLAPPYTAEFDTDKDSSDLECASEQTITETIESSRSNANLYYVIPNNPNVSSTIITNNHSNLGQSSNINNIFVPNLVVTPTQPAAVVTQNPILLTYLVTPLTIPHFAKDVITNENQLPIRERLIMDDDINTNQIDLEVLPANTRSSTPDSMSESETTDISDIEEKVNPETELTITETTVGFNTSTSDKETDNSISRNNIENTDLTANNRPCNASDINNTVSSSTNGIEQNCDSSISPEGVLVKTEDQIKTEPLDIQNMLDELGDGFVSQVFDIEDPFLVIEISSDESTDDEEL